MLTRDLRSIAIAIASLAAAACDGAPAGQLSGSAPRLDRSRQSAPAPTFPGARVSTPSVGSARINPNAPHVQLVGRFDERDPLGPSCAWPGCRIVASVDGAPAISARLAETSRATGPSEWDVSVDGQVSSKLVLEEGTHDYELARELTAGKHTIELYKRTEAQSGSTQFLGFDLHGGELATPPPRRTRHLEIVGDSDATGLGYEGAIRGSCAPGPSSSARYQNFRAAWGERLAGKVDAELYGTSFSGKGFYFNVWRPDTETIEQIFLRADPNRADSLWDRSQWTPDAVLVEIGRSDYAFGEPEDEGGPPLEAFTGKARDFVKLVRAGYPTAHLFLVASALLSDRDPPGREQRTNVETALKAVTADLVAAADARVHFVAPPPATRSELTGCDGHGGPEYHERVAVYLEAEVRSKLGW